MKIEIINQPMLCWDDNESEAREYHILAKVTECNSNFLYKAICNKNTHPNKPEHEGAVAAGGGFKNAKPLLATKPRTIEDGLVYGDIIANNLQKRKVLGVCNEIIFISCFNRYDMALESGFTLKELIDSGYTLYTEQPQEIVELTIQDISEGKGKGIDPKLIRIKE